MRCPSNGKMYLLFYIYYMDFTDIEVEDIITASEAKKKKINSKKKGNRVELALTKLLTKRFDKPFSRSVGSGNRWGQVKGLPSHAKTTLSGDICPPEGFLWVIECKGGYDQIDLNRILEQKNSTIEMFIKQSLHDSATTGRKPIIMWKRDRLPWLVLILEKDAPPISLFKRRVHYDSWLILSLTELLDATPDSFWFEGEIDS